MPIIEDATHDPRADSSGRNSSHSPLLYTMKNFIHKKIFLLGLGISLFFVILITSSLGTFFYFKNKNARIFKSKLIRHIEKEHPILYASQRITYVDELVKIHKSGRITDDAENELDMFVSFKNFVEKNKRAYPNFEKFTERFLIYRKNYSIVHGIKDDHIYSLELNKFADITDDEFDAILTEIPQPKYFTPISKHIEHIKRCLTNPSYISKLKKAKKNNIDISDAEKITGEDLDWRHADIITHIKDQTLKCSSSWAFASIGSVETAYKLFKNKNYNLSEQELINCDKYSKACAGGNVTTALEYIHGTGIALTKEYPYIAAEDKCTINTDNKLFIDSISITKGIDILNKSLIMSPTIVAIAASHELKFYKEGIFTGKCGSKLNLAVLLVGEGYDEKTNKRYWIIKNSWGKDWGEDGYLRLERIGDSNDKCGILTFGLNPMLY